MTTSPRTAAPGHIVLWCPDGRSPATHQRAQDGDCAPLGRLLADSDLVLSICPPAVAEPIAAQVAEAEALLSEAHR
ncbi:MAG TPA: hypothetical protein VFQ77_16805, partial [Pseudonocardiaceae bacterium]|nr:hypothetical protein [Pseudonocardiaceae bacterium]